MNYLIVTQRRTTSGEYSRSTDPQTTKDGALASFYSQLPPIINATVSKEDTSYKYAECHIALLDEYNRNVVAPIDWARTVISE